MQKKVALIAFAIFSALDDTDRRTDGRIVWDRQRELLVQHKLSYIVATAANNVWCMDVAAFTCRSICSKMTLKLHNLLARCFRTTL